MPFQTSHTALGFKLPYLFPTFPRLGNLTYLHGYCSSVASEKSEQESSAFQITGRKVFQAAVHYRGQFSIEEHIVVSHGPDDTRPLAIDIEEFCAAAMSVPSASTRIRKWVINGESVMLCHSSNDYSLGNVVWACFVRLLLMLFLVQLHLLVVALLDHYAVVYYSSCTRMHNAQCKF